VDFGFNDEQQAIKETAREMLAKRSPLEKVRAAAEARAYDDALWAEIRGLGWPGIVIPEEYGGQGLGTVELAILCEELGYACAPAPFLSNASAALFIDQAGSDEQRQRWLPRIASGEERGAAAFEPRSNELVPDAAGAAVLVLNDGDRAILVEAGDAEIEPVELVDATRLYARVLDSGGDPLPGDVEAAADRSLVALAAELTGIAQRAMEMAMDYSRQRVTFGQPLSERQAIQFMIADSAIDIHAARLMVHSTAWRYDQGEEVRNESYMTKIFCTEMASRVVDRAIQIHGGVGLTMELPLQYWFRQVRSIRITEGVTEVLRWRMARNLIRARG
jgi:alkylation response protein AidB-like acyl-CoA dehydrogenase